MKDLREKEEEEEEEEEVEKKEEETEDRVTCFERNKRGKEKSYIPFQKHSP